MKQTQFKVVGQYLAEKRKARGYSQSQIARELGYTAQFVSNWERGQALPPIPALRRLIGLLDLNNQEVIGLLLNQHKAYYETELQKAANDQAAGASSSTSPQSATASQLKACGNH